MPTYIHVDVETTSTNTSQAIVLSVGAVEQETKQTFHAVFHSVDNHTLPWDQNTWDWWHSEPLIPAHDRLVKLYEQHNITPENAALEFVEWVNQFNNGSQPTFCAWPASFDYPLVVEFLQVYDLPSPFSYRTLDVKSYLCGKLGIDIDAPRTAFPGWVELKPEHEHDALSDAIAQMVVFEKVLAL